MCLFAESPFGPWRGALVFIVVEARAGEFWPEFTSSAIAAVILAVAAAPGIFGLYSLAGFKPERTTFWVGKKLSTFREGTTVPSVLMQVGFWRASSAAPLRRSSLIGLNSLIRAAPVDA